MAKKSASRILWKSPPLPAKVFSDDEWVWRIRGEAQALADSDTPSTKDLRYAFHRYNEATAAERDAMDSVFVWFTGYTLATIIEKTKAKGGMKNRGL
jgi:hypothetical protein